MIVRKRFFILQLNLLKSLLQIPFLKFVILEDKKVKKQQLSFILTYSFLYLTNKCTMILVEKFKCLWFTILKQIKFIRKKSCKYTRKNLDF